MTSRDKSAPVQKPFQMTLASTKRAMLVSIVVIIVITVLEFPPPIGFETRPQTDVSAVWLVLFMVILVSEVAAVPLVYRSARIGGGFGVIAAVLNMLQVVADQVHLMQPEVAPLGYSILELLVVVASAFLLYFSWNAMRSPSPV